MFVVSYAGILHGPFQTADAAAKFGEAINTVAPWSIIPIKEASGIINQVSVNDPAGVRRLVKAVAAKRHL